MKTSHVESAHQEWDYGKAESDFHDEGMTVSRPCHLEFTEEPDRDIERFHDALADRNWAPLSGHYAVERMQEKGGVWYKGEVADKDQYNRVNIRVMRGNVVRLYPNDDHIPSVPRLATLTRAIEAGWKAPLVHKPIED